MSTLDQFHINLHNPALAKVSFWHISALKKLHFLFAPPVDHLSLLNRLEPDKLGYSENWAWKGKET